LSVVALEYFIPGFAVASNERHLTRLVALQIETVQVFFGNLPIVFERADTNVSTRAAFPGLAGNTSRAGFNMTSGAI
jgi:hypothetical protein